MKRTARKAVEVVRVGVALYRELALSALQLLSRPDLRKLAEER